MYKLLTFCFLFLTGFLAKAQVITVTGYLSTLVTCEGSVSATQSFNVAGSALTNNLNITVVPGFEISTIPGNGFVSTLSLSPVAGTVNSTPIYVRITSTATGSPSGNIICTSTGAATKTVAVSGMVKSLPVVNAVANQNLCPNSATAAINFTSTTGPGTIYNWTNNNTSIGLAAMGSGNIPSFTALNTVNTAIAANVIVTGSTPAVGPRAYIPLTGTNFFSALSVIDLATNTVLTTFPMALHPAGVCPSPDGSRIYITNRLSNFLSILNPIDNSIIGTIGVGTDPIFVKPTPDGSRVYVGNTTGNSVSVINTATSSVIATIPVGTWPSGIAVSPDATRVYVANRNSGDVTVINALTNTVITSIPLGGAGLGSALSSDGSRLYVSLQVPNGQVAVINTATNLVTGTIPVGAFPINLVLNHAGTRLYVANQLSNNLSVINVATGTVITTIPTGLDPFGVSISPDDSRVYVTNNTSKDVVVIDAANYTIITSIPMPGNPGGHGNFINPGTGRVCIGPSKNFTITVNPSSVVNTIANQNLCSGATSQAVNFSGGPAGTIYNWVNNNTNIGLPANGTGNINPFTVTNNTGTPITAIISVTSTYNGCLGASKNFSVIVSPGAGNVTIDSIPSEVCLNNATIKLTGTPTGGIWTGRGITGNNFYPAAAGIGTAMLAYSFTNSGGCSASSSVNITVKDCADSTTELCRSIQLLPNPNKGQFNLRILTKNLSAFDARIIDASGRLLRKYHFSGNIAFGTLIPFDVRYLPNGTYMLELFTHVKKCIYKVVIVR